MIDAREPRGVGMPPARHLHRREPREGEEVAERVHAHIRIEKDVQALLGHRLARRLEPRGQDDRSVGRAIDRLSQRVAARLGMQDDDLEALAVELRDETPVELADGVVVQERGKKPHAKPTPPSGTRHGPGRAPAQLRVQPEVHRRDRALQFEVRQAVIRQVEAGHPDPARGLVERERPRGDVRDARREFLAHPPDAVAGVGDHGHRERAKHLPVSVAGREPDRVVVAGRRLARLPVLREESRHHALDVRVVRREACRLARDPERLHVPLLQVECAAQVHPGPDMPGLPSQHVAQQGLGFRGAREPVQRCGPGDRGLEGARRKGERLALRFLARLEAPQLEQRAAQVVPRGSERRVDVRRPAEGHLGIAGTLQREKRRAAVVVRARVPRLERDQRVEGRDGLLVPAEPEERVPQEREDARVPRREAKGLPEARSRLLEAGGAERRMAAHHPHGHELAVPREELLAQPEGLLEASRREQLHPEIGRRIGIAGIGIEGGAIRGKGLLPPVHPLKHGAARVVGEGIARRIAQQAVDEAERLLGAASPQRDEGEQVANVGAGRLAQEQGARGAIGLLEASRLEEPHCALQGRRVLRGKRGWGSRHGKATEA